ncbi:MAG: hemerythrin domain-containing protein [Oceanospirillaceae bacterium]|nr:hemerythrin domain-containing protein [Oceanospirillaceae bacterium]
MTTEPNSASAGSNEDPLTDFSNCHVGIINNFERLRALSLTEIESPVQADVKTSAKKLYAFFRDVVLEHHSEEEQELFAEVKDSSRKGGDDAAKALGMIDQLVREHRSLEAQWKAIESDIKQLSKGKPASLDQEAAGKLADDYLAHANFEEQEFLPLSAKLLGERGLSSLGLSLHMRHTHVSIPNYI